jgi:hypothetical protein
MIEKIEDYNKNLVLLIGRYKDSNNFKKLLNVFNKGADEIEKAMFEIRDLFWLNTAVGKQLDIIGDILNALREGRDDDEYRNYIKEIIQLLNSGAPEQIISALKSLYGFTGNIIYRHEYPAGYFIFGDYGLDNIFLQRFNPAGVKSFFAIPIAQGDLDLDEPWLVDAHGQEICCVRPDNAPFLLDDDNFLITDDDELLVGD